MLISQLTKSSFWSSFVTFVYFILAYFLDKRINNKVSNIIALVSTTLLNFFIQSQIFLKKSHSISHKHFFKFIIILFIDILINQFFFSVLLNQKTLIIKFIPVFLQKYYNTIIRAVSHSMVFLLFSFPLRKYWIFI